MTKIFDTPANAAPVSTAVFDRKDKITYTWQPIPSNYNISLNATSFLVDTPASLGGPYPDTTVMDAWMDNNAGRYDTKNAKYSVDFHEVDFTGGRCVVSPDVPVQWPCEMFSKWNLDPATNTRKGLLVLTPKVDWSYTVTLNIVDGEIIQRVFDGCPEFSFTPYTDGYIVSLSLCMCSLSPSFIDNDNDCDRTWNFSTP